MASQGRLYKQKLNWYETTLVIHRICKGLEGEMFACLEKGLLRWGIAFGSCKIGSSLPDEWGF